jgi:hypothetical protein
MTTPFADASLVPGASHDPARVKVDFWFDPACPFAWITSRWMLELEQLGIVHVDFHLMSLSILDEGRKVSPEYREKMEGFWAAARVAVVTEARFGQRGLRQLYTALGTRRHEQNRSLNADTIREALVACRLPLSLIRAAETDEYDEDLRVSHQRGVELVGPDVGTPIVLLPEGAVFGPIMTRIPRGPAAIEVWKSVCHLVANEHFFELKRTRTKAPQFD